MLRRYPRRLIRWLLSLTSLIIFVVVVRSKFLASVISLTQTETTTHPSPVNNDSHLQQLYLEERQRLQETRLMNMQSRCDQLKDSWKEPTWQAISVNYERRVVMCLVGKAAGTTWMRLLLRMTGKTGALKLATTDRHVLHGQVCAFIGRFQHINTSIRQHYLMGHYYKVMFVREPLERLISGYRDKMFRAVDYVKLRTQIKQMFRPNVSMSSPAFQKNVTFDEFVRYVVWEHKYRRHLDVHWRPQYDVCRPCHIQFHYLGYYETMSDDAKDVLRNIHASSDVQFPSTDFDSRLPNSNSYLQLFENVSVSDLRQLLSIYQNDYTVFGYEIPRTVRQRLELDTSTVSPEPDRYKQRAAT